MVFAHMTREHAPLKRAAKNLPEWKDTETMGTYLESDYFQSFRNHVLEHDILAVKTLLCVPPSVLPAPFCQQALHFRRDKELN